LLPTDEGVTGPHADARFARLLMPGRRVPTPPFGQAQALSGEPASPAAVGALSPAPLPGTPVRAEELNGRWVPAD